MGGLSRRGIMRGMIGAGALTMAPYAGLAAARVSFPSHTMQLTRILKRELHDGNFLTVERQWRVSFAAMASGIRVTGEQMSAEVDAPAKIASLARIEEARIDNSLFPLDLSDEGLIISGGSEAETQSFAQAFTEAEQLLANDLAANKALAMRHIAQMQAAVQPLFNILPQDFFFPKGSNESAVRQVALPDGSHGEFDWSYTASHAAGHAWLERAERRIITRIGASSRMSSESWMMAELAAGQSATD